MQTSSDQNTVYYQNTFDNYQPLRSQILYTPNVLTHLPQGHHSHNIHTLNQNQNALVANAANSSIPSQSLAATQGYQYRQHHQHSPTIVAHQYENFTTWSNNDAIYSINQNSNNNTSHCAQPTVLTLDNRSAQTYENMNFHQSNHKTINTGTTMHLNSNISIRSRLDSTNSSTVNAQNASSNSNSRDNPVNNIRNNHSKSSNDQANIEWTAEMQQLGDNGK